MDRWIDGLMDLGRKEKVRREGERQVGRKWKLRKERMDGLMDGWIDGWMDGWID